MSGYSIRLFFPDGRPDGICEAHIPSREARILVVPRIQFKEFLDNRAEANRAGIYFLLGETDENGETCYIGESKKLGGRIKEHFRSNDKEWWSVAILITSSADNLNKADIEYLESQFIKKAAESKMIFLVNDKSAPTSSLGDAQSASMEGFISDAMKVLPALQIDFLTSQAHEKSSNKEIPAADESITRFNYESARLGLRATARQENGMFVVEKDSIARGKWKGENPRYFASKRLREDLMRQGILKKQGDKLIFAKDCDFRSPTAAAEVVLGRAESGPITWKVEGTNQTYQEWEAERVAAASGD